MSCLVLTCSGDVFPLEGDVVPPAQPLSIKYIKAKQDADSVIQSLRPEKKSHLPEVQGQGSRR